MNVERREDAEYPYAARSGTPAAVADSSYSEFLARRQFLWLWLVRLTIGAALVAIVLVTGVGFVAYRVGLQAMWVREVEQAGYRVVYLHELPGQVDPLPQSLRGLLGNGVWSEVSEVSSSNGWGWRGLFDDPSRICLACSNFPRLRSFSIDNDRFTCEMMRNWPSFDRMEELDIKSERLTDADLAVIGRMSNLKSLKLHGAKVTAQGIGHLAKLKRLETLGLYSVEFTGSSSQYQNTFPALKSLIINQSPGLGDDAIIQFGSLPNLEDVNVHRSSIGDRGLAQLLSGGNVHSLVMSETRITDAAFALLGNYDRCWIVLSGRELTDKGLESLAGKQIPSLLLDGTSITDDGLRALAELKSLRYLSLSNCRVTGTGLKYLDSSEPLERLDLSGTMLTRDGIAALAKSTCKELDLSRTFVGDKELMLFAGNRDLSEVDLSKTKITAAGVQAFYRERQRLLGSTGSGEPVRVLTDFGHFLSETQATDPLTELPIQIGAIGGQTN